MEYDGNSRVVYSSKVVASLPTIQSAASFASHALLGPAPVDQLCPNELQLINKRFKPKFSPSELVSNPLKHAAVFISEAYQPKCVYVRIVDEMMPHYCQMRRDLQLHFNSASRRSVSYCPSPVQGSVIYQY